MTAPVVYDLSRLALRVSRSVPSGIDRVDLDWARDVLAREDACAIVVGALGPRVVPAAAGRVIVSALEAHWGEGLAPAQDGEFRRVRAQILGDTLANTSAAPARTTRSVARTALEILARSPLGFDGLFPGRSPLRAIPQGAFYVNASQFPLAIPSLCSWLDQRRDLRSAILVHDMLPIRYPEFFPPGEADQHERFLHRAATLADVLVVTSATTAEALKAHLLERELRVPRIEVLPLSVDPIFSAPPSIDADLATQPYFIVCGTIEPRKNHLLLLNVWRDLARQMGPATPTLVIVGAKGWEFENVMDLVERCEEIRDHVVLTSRLGSSSLKQLLDNCRGLLMPTFAEGFGLPVAEALAAGVPVVASRIAALERQHRESGAITFLDPIDGLGWRDALLHLTDCPPPPRAAQSNGLRENCAVCSFDHGAKVIPRVFHSRRLA